MGKIQIYRFAIIVNPFGPNGFPPEVQASFFLYKRHFPAWWTDLLGGDWRSVPCTLGLIFRVHWKHRLSIQWVCWLSVGRNV